jgi:hypothetical protein
MNAITKPLGFLYDLAAHEDDENSYALGAASVGDSTEAPQ